MILTLSLTTRTLPKGHREPAQAGLGCFLVGSGSVEVDGEAVPAGSGHMAAKESLHVTKDARIHEFRLSETAPQNCDDAREINVSAPFILRLDEIIFPPGAVAYRHVHTGPGFRHLREGRLHLEAEDHAFTAEVGTTWFEDAHAPVRAMADPDMAQTAFVRCMVLPPEFLGKPTIQILDPDDAQKPRLQQTVRHVDHLVHTWP